MKTANPARRNERDLKEIYVEATVEAMNETIFVTPLGPVSSFQYGMHGHLWWATPETHVAYPYIPVHCFQNN